MAGELGAWFVVVLAVQRLILLLKVALVAALAGYTLPSASLAMHGSSSASYVAASVAGSPDPAHAAHVSAFSHDHGGSGGHHAEEASAEAGKNLTQDCCSDYCLSLALVGDGPVFRFDRTPLPVSFADDERVFAAPIGFNRPPAFRA